MKKLTAIILALAICLLPMGCANNIGSSKLNGVQDTDYIVYNNGSNAVQYGNYLYFVNGTRGYDDTDGKNNVWGSVTKGGLYRVELNGKKNGRNFDMRSANSEYGNFSNGYFTGIYFKNYSPYVEDSNGEKRYLDENAEGNNDERNAKFDELIENGSVILEVEKTVKDEDGNDTDETETEEETFTFDDLKYEVKNVDRLASKTIGTSDYSKGGIFIFDDFCYYASPNNERNKTGVIQTSLTDFFATKLDGSVTYKLYTSAETTSSSPYAFYKYGDSVYLNVLDGQNLVSVKIVNGKNKEVNKIAENITSAVMPVNKIYDSQNHNEKDVAEYIYTTRSATEDDRDLVGSDSGTVIECMRPDGNDRRVLFAYSSACSVEAVSDGLVYYRLTDPNTNSASLRYTNIPEITASATFSGELVANVADYTSFYIYNANSAYEGDKHVLSESDIFVIAKKSTGLYVINGGEERKISNTSGDTFAVDGNMVYFRSGSSIMRCNIAPTEEFADETVVSNVATTGLLPSVVNGMLVYNGQIDSNIQNYAHVYFIESETSQFVGEISKTDLNEEE